MKKYNKSIIMMIVMLVVAIIGQRVSSSIGTIFMVLAIIAFLYNLWRLYKANELKKRIQPYKTYYKLILLAATFILPSVFIAPNISHAWHVFFEVWLYRIMPFFMVTLLVRSEKLLKYSMASCIVMFCVEALYAAYSVLADLVNRAGGFTGNIMQFANVMTIVLPITLIAALDDKFSRNTRIVAGLATIMLVAGTIAEKTRGMWLAIVVVIFIIYLYYAVKSKKVLILGLVTILLGGLAYQYQPTFRNRVLSIINYEHENSAEARIYLWGRAYDMGNEHMLTGVGLGEFKTYSIANSNGKNEWDKLPHAHNEVMNMWAETGFFGTLGFLIFAGYVLFHNFWSWYKTRNPYEMMIWTSWLSLLLFGITEVCFNKTTIRIWWFILGVCLVLVDTTENKVTMKE